MGKPRVSIIMGMYNAEKSVRRCIESIQSQTFIDWEFIICDDCSTDASYEITKDIANHEPRIILIQNEVNSKLAATLNHCLKFARGEYIARMDSDDFSLPMRLELQVEFLDSHPQYEVVGAGANVTDGQRIIEVRIPTEIPLKYEVIKSTPFIHPSIMMRKRAYDALQGYAVLDRTIRGQDLDLWFRFYALGFHGYNLQFPLIEYTEKKEDFKKRTLKTALMYTKTNAYGYRLLKLPAKYIPYVVKPIIAFMTPNSMLVKYHQVKSRLRLTQSKEK